MMLFGVSSFGQGGGVWNFDWNMGFPMGDTKDFIGQPTFRGFSIEGRSYVTENITVGGIAGWSVFYEILVGLLKIEQKTTAKFMAIKEDT